MPPNTLLTAESDHPVVTGEATLRAVNGKGGKKPEAPVLGKFDGPASHENMFVFSEPLFSDMNHDGPPQDFLWTQKEHFHYNRRREILAKYPQVGDFCSVMCFHHFHISHHSALPLFLLLSLLCLCSVLSNSNSGSGIVRH